MITGSFGLYVAKTAHDHQEPGWREAQARARRGARCADLDLTAPAALICTMLESVSGTLYLKDEVESSVH